MFSTHSHVPIRNLLSLQEHTEIAVLKPSLPKCEDLVSWLKQIDKNQWYSNFGPLNQKFVEQLSQFFDNCALTTTSSGTTALEAAIASLELPQGSKILVPSLTFPATVSAVLRNGLRPVITDIDKENWQLTPSIAEKACRQHKIRAVIPVATFGLEVDTVAWEQFSEATNCPVIIDAAGAFGNQNIGNVAATIFSLHATKPFSSGEGGLIVSKDEAFIRQATKRINFGINPSTRSIDMPNVCNAKLSEYHAAVGLASLTHWPKHKKRRIQLLDTYQQQLSKFAEKVDLQAGCSNRVISIFNVKINHSIEITELQERLKRQKIQSHRWYYPLIHNHPAFANLEKASDLKVSKSLSQKLIGLPFHLSLSDKDVIRVCNALSETLK